jgi:tetratricopeptide (TPR) repeat protein
MLSSKIISPIFFSISIFLSLFWGCSDTDTRKIKLAESGDIVKTSGQAGTSILRISPEEQKTLVIRYFQNHTGDPALEWLERGLADMLNSELSQSPYLNIITESQFLEVAKKMEMTDKELEDRLNEVRVAAKINAQILLTGHISYKQKALIVEITLTDALTGAEIRKEKVTGEGLENLLSIVNELAEKLRQFLREKGQRDQLSSVKVSEMTTSLEAFRCYSKALENKEKYIHASAEDCLLEALKYDSTFAAAYLELFNVQFALKRDVNYEEIIHKAELFAHKLSYGDKIKLELIIRDMRGEPFKKISILEEAIENSPLDLELRFVLAQTYRRLGHEEKAMQEFEEVIDQDPDYKMAYNDLGYLYADMGDFKTALYMLDKYQKIAPDEPNPHDSKGEILVLAGKLEEAAEEYKKALEILPTYYNSAFRLADIYAELGDQDRALEYVNYGVKSVPNSGMQTGADFAKARIYWRFGNMARADELVKNLLNKHPYWAELMIRRVEMYRSFGKNELADELELKGFEKFKQGFQKRPPSYDFIKAFMQYVTYSQLPLDLVVPELEALIELNDISDQHMNFGWAVDFCNLYRGRTKPALTSFKKKIPNLLHGIQLQRKEIGWASSWKNLFLFFDFETTGDELSEFVAASLKKLANEDNRADIEFIANMALARAKGGEKHLDQSRQIYTKFGVPVETRWKFCGPFRNSDVSGFNHAYPPENEIDLSATYVNNNRKITWATGQDRNTDGHFNLTELYDMSSFATAYGLIYIKSPDERKVQVRIGSDEACKFWLNDKLIWQHYIKRDAVADRDIMTVVLHPGYNKILLKITNTDLDWGFYFRVTDKNGYGYSAIEFISPDVVETSLASVN